MTENSIKEDTSGLFRTNGGGNGNKMHHLAKPVDEHNDTSVVVSIGRIAKDEIHTNGTPIILWNRKRVQRSLTRRGGLDALAHIASANVFTNPFIQMRPVKVA